MTDNLSQLTDAELSEVFAVEVATDEVYDHMPDYAIDAFAVMPSLEKWRERGDVMAFSYKSSKQWTVTLYNVTGRPLEWAEASAFPRAACIALIRAKRAEKQ